MERERERESWASDRGRGRNYKEGIYRLEEANCNS
jgi:hypothetical protein